jgi:hypothetical protein
MKSQITYHKSQIGCIAGLLAFACFASSCGMLFYHNPQQARETAYKFLNAVYMQGDFKKAYSLVDADFDRNYGAGYLEKISARFFKVFDKLEGLRADAYLIEQGQRSIMILFTGISEKAPSFHKVMLMGDGSRGYWVSSVIYSDIPFTGFRTLKPFK